MRKSLVLALASASSLAVVAPVVAQELAPQVAEAAGDESELTEDSAIIVTARRKDEALQDVPQTINVVTAQQIEQLNLRSFEEIQQIVPGLTMQTTSAYSSQATVRGIAFVPEASGNNASVAFYLNDAPISSSFLFQSTYDFGQFELQRGPQGTLRGKASPSGAIGYTTRRPDLRRFTAAASGTVTDTHAFKVDGVFNLPVIENVLALRVAGVIDHDRGNQVNTIKAQGADGELNSRPFNRTKSVRASARFEPADWISADIMYQHLETKGRSYSQVVSNSLYDPAAPLTTQLIRPFDRLAIEDQGSFSRQKHDVVVGNLDIRFAGQKLSYVGSYSHQNNGSMGQADTSDYFAEPRINLVRRQFVDFAGYEPVCQREGALVGLNPTSGSYFQCTNNIARRMTHEVRVSSVERIGNVFDYVVGVFYDKNENPSRITQEGGPGGSGTPVVNVATGNVNAPGLRSIIRNGESVEKSIFANLTGHLLDDRLELSGGIRHISYENWDELVLGLGNNAAPRVQSPAVPEKRSHTIYTASAKYEFSSETMAYALIGSSWRPGPRVVGNFSVGPTGNGPTDREKSFLNLPDETSTSYELGVKTSFLNGRGRLNLSTFYQKFQNYPFRGPGVPYLNYSSTSVAPTVSSFNFVAPVPVTVFGVEAEAGFNILERWSVSVNASYADGKIKNGTIACTDLNGDGIPDVNAVVPTNPADFAATLEPGETMAQCSGINRRSSTTPKFSANLQTQYAFDLNDRMSGFVRGSATFRGKTAGNPETTYDDQEAYTTVNLFAGVRGQSGNWEVTAFIKNLFDNQRINSVGSSPLRAQINTTGGAIQYVSEYRSISVTPPREFGLSARISFGGR